MLVNATEMLIKARDGHYGVPQFNINNLEWTKSVLTACEEMKSPVILGVSEGAGKYMTGFKTVAAMVSISVAFTNIIHYLHKIIGALLVSCLLCARLNELTGLVYPKQRLKSIQMGFFPATMRQIDPCGEGDFPSERANIKQKTTIFHKNCNMKPRGGKAAKGRIFNIDPHSSK